MQALRPPFDTSGPEILFAGNQPLARVPRAPLRAPRGQERLRQRHLEVGHDARARARLPPRARSSWRRASRTPTAASSPRRTPRGARSTTSPTEKGYRSYVIPDSVGGRFSVLTPVGLVPIAAAGIDVRALFYGAVADARETLDADASHPALQYAGDRFLFHEAGYKTEILAVMDAVAEGHRRVVAAALRRVRGQGAQGSLPGRAPVHDGPALGRAVRAAGPALARRDLPAHRRRRPRARRAARWRATRTG